MSTMSPTVIGMNLLILELSQCHRVQHLGQSPITMASCVDASGGLAF